VITFLATRFLALPLWAIKAIEFLVLLAALAASLVWAHHYIYQQGYDAAVAARKAEDNTALVAAQAKSAADQKELSDKFLLAQRDRFKENEDAKTAIEALRRRVQYGAVVLHLRPGSEICSIAAPSSATIGPGSVGEVGPDSLVPSAADAIVSIAGRIKSGVRRENNLIDSFNSCRDAANAQ
jgi:hypothetical protein